MLAQVHRAGLPRDEAVLELSKSPTSDSQGMDHGFLCQNAHGQGRQNEWHSTAPLRALEKLLEKVEETMLLPLHGKRHFASAFQERRVNLTSQSTAPNPIPNRQELRVLNNCTDLSAGARYSHQSVPPATAFFDTTTNFGAQSERDRLSALFIGPSVSLCIACSAVVSFC